MTTRQFAKLLPPDYQKLKQGRGKPTWFVRQSKQSCIMAVAERTSVKNFLPEFHSRDNIFHFFGYDKEESCFVDFRDVAVGSTLCRYYITKNQTKEQDKFAHYFLFMDIYHEGEAFRLFASGDECGDAFLRRTETENTYNKVVLEALQTEKPTTKFSFVYRTLKTGCSFTIGEDPFYDAFFPEHPLTQLRNLVQTILRQLTAKSVAAKKEVA